MIESGLAEHPFSKQAAERAVHPLLQPPVRVCDVGSQFETRQVCRKLKW